MPTTTGGAVARAAAEIGDWSTPKLVAFTQSGDTARRLSRYRSPIPVLAFTPKPAARSQLALTWGVETFLGPPVAHRRDGRAGRRRAAGSRPLPEGRQGRHHRGLPARDAGSTNALRVHRIGDAIASGL